MSEKNTREQELLFMKYELMVQTEFEALLCEYLNSNHRRKVERITKAFNFAKQAHAGVKRRNGDPYIMHPIAVARIVCGEMGLGSTSICAALLHDVVEDTEYEVKDISNMFNNKIAQLVDGLTKISGDIFADKDSKQAENFRKLLLTMSSDIRVILIKMADRLHNMRTLGSMRTDKQFKIAGETMFIYAPLAHRLGLFAIKTELEDLSFKYEHPEDFRIINEKLQDTEELRQRLFDNFARPVHQRLQELNLTYEMKARVKSAYSIWNKMSTKGVPFEDIYDIFAIRIIFRPTGDVDEKNLCWDIYAAITDIYRTRPDRLRDWVSRPKANGYQALHLTVMGPNGQWIEIQIRSKRMDEIDEKGFAAHWKYKENNVEEDTELDKWLQTITEILENPNPNTLDFLDTIKMNLFSAEIFVFTPKGELKTLPKGATALDFAYDLHTNIGDTCIGAKINHHLAPLSHRLESGDQVEVLTSKSQHPKIEWLNYVTTAKARTKIESVLRRERKELANAGKKKVMDAFSKVALEPTQSYLDKLTTYFGFSKREDFYYAIEKGDVTIPENIRKLLREKNGNVILKYVKKAFGVGKKKPRIITPTYPEPEKPVFDKTKPYELREELFRRNYVVASCCKPIPGDDVFGFINDDNNVIVHKRSCPLGIRLKSNFGERILSTVWSNHTSSSFEATLHVTGIDGVGVLTDIAKTISGFNVNIIRLLIETKDGMFEGKINMMVHDVEDIQKMCIALSKIKNIQSVSRIAD
ncbi:MAG: RelA/SpoT family protein [Dysgonamonadaceae bacterium]|jgi:GTP pyrophosphokinase|nr:RelA/SpoT family protein [Dysgonamonadaceae bacterium]